MTNVVGLNDTRESIAGHVHALWCAVTDATEQVNSYEIDAWVKAQRGSGQHERVYHDLLEARVLLRCAEAKLTRALSTAKEG